MFIVKAKISKPTKADLVLQDFKFDEGMIMSFRARIILDLDYIRSLIQVMLEEEK